MARKSLFTISLEDEDILDNVEATETIEVEEVVAAEEEQAEFQEAAEEVEEEVVALEESEEVVAELEEQAATQEQIIEEKPEEITEDTVQIAQESFMCYAAKLGKTYEELKMRRISSETVTASPVQAFKVSTEDIKEFAAKALEMIKNLFAKIAASLKKLRAKFVVFMDRTAANALKLVNSYRSKKGDIKLSEEVSKKIISKLPVMIAANGGKVDSSLLDFVQIDFVKDVVGGVKAGTSIETPKFVNNAVHKKILDFVVKAGAENVTCVTQAYKSTVTYVSAENGEVKTFEVTKDKFDGVKLSGLGSYRELAEILVKVARNGKENKKYADGLENSQKEVMKKAEEISKGGEDTAEARKQLRLLRSLGSKLVLDSIMQYVNVNKALVAICTTAGGQADSEEAGKAEAESEKK